MANVNTRNDAVNEYEAGTVSSFLLPYASYCRFLRETGSGLE